MIQKMRSAVLLISIIFCQKVLAAQDCSSLCPSWWTQGWALTIYSGPLSVQNNSDIFFSDGFQSAHASILAIAPSKKLVNFLDNRLDLELETQLVQHFGDQTHLEVNPFVFILRWNAFPWNAYLPTTLAIGDGLSIATDTAEAEVARKQSADSRVLNYVMAEITLSLPEHPQWALVGRYHHRSGAFGAYNGVWDASTAFAAGLKYWF